MKQVRLGRIRWNLAFLDFADHHGFTPKTHRAYRSRTKGKVKRAVDYVLEATANVRVHGTTGRWPVDLLFQEGLLPVGSVPSNRFVTFADRTASFEAMVTYERSRCPAPPGFVGKPVRVSALEGHVVIRAGEAVIADHREAAEPG